MRNVGGHAKPALNDIVALDAGLTITDILVVHHTGISNHVFSTQVKINMSLDCGTTHFKDAGVQAILKERLPDHKGIDEMEFGAIDE